MTSAVLIDLRGPIKIVIMFFKQGKVAGQTIQQGKWPVKSSGEKGGEEGARREGDAEAGDGAVGIEGAGEWEGEEEDLASSSSSRSTTAG